MVISMQKSTKCIGRFEEPLIDRISKYFECLGYTVFSHVRFNVAWGSSLSDIDILLSKDNLISVVEVKSKRDKIFRAKKQIETISDYIDYAYVATDRLPKSWELANIGLLHVDEHKIRVVKEAKRIVRRPRVESLFALPKKCLARFLGGAYSQNHLKWDMIGQLDSRCSDEFLRHCLKEIVLCQSCNDTNCPVFIFVSSNIPEFNPDPPDSFF